MGSQIRTSKRTKTRNRVRTRSEILQIAFLEVFRHGFQGVSIDDIVAKSQLTKGALYHQFPNKLQLGYALVEEVITPMIVERWIEPLKSYPDPTKGILEILDERIGKCPPHYLKLGCPLNNLVQEMSPLDPGFHNRLQAALQLWIHGIAEQIERGKKNRVIKKSVQSQEAAQFIVMAHEGFYGLIKGLEGEDVYRSLRKSLQVFLNSLKADPI